MSASGIRVELAVDSGGACPVSSVSAEAGTAVTDVARSTVGTDDPAVEEFTVTETTEALEDRTDVTRVFDADRGGRYRLDERGGTCPCESIEEFACPIADVEAEDGQLLLTFYAPDIDRIRAIVTRMRELYDGVSLRSLREEGTTGSEDSVLVDRGQLTDRQREVLETAVQMGYFEYPKGANAGEVAEALDITVSTFAEHLAAAETKLLGTIVEE
ncbi:helix-turn-helix domain-containing protein [Halomicroarcula sp. GCM10025324]|uniref:helix-turn-helix domain-containing protein n=1 Tax=Haloarcula TaxID=2237 RepID=UPI0023E82E41|nr:helix-turn-helix domain-containing protein [Halomicroarcula sp. ZS-22-S1]